MRCPTCSGPMTPMVFSWFCPKDCDKPQERPKRQTVPGLGGPLPPGPWKITVGWDQKRQPYDPIPGIPNGLPIKVRDGRLSFDHDGKTYTWNPIGHWEWVAK